MEQRVIGSRSYGRLVDKVRFKEHLLATLLIYHYAPSSLLANVMGSKQSEIESVLVDLVVDYCKSVGKVDFKQVNDNFISKPFSYSETISIGRPTILSSNSPNTTVELSILTLRSIRPGRSPERLGIAWFLLELKISSILLFFRTCEKSFLQSF